VEGRLQAALAYIPVAEVLVHVPAVGLPVVDMRPVVGLPVVDMRPVVGLPVVGMLPVKDNPGEGGHQLEGRKREVLLLLTPCLVVSITTKFSLRNKVLC